MGTISKNRNALCQFDVTCPFETYDGKDMSVGEWETGGWVRDKFISTKVGLGIKKNLRRFQDLVFNTGTKTLFLFNIRSQKYAAITAQNHYSPFLLENSNFLNIQFLVFLSFCFIHLSWSQATQDATFHSIVNKSSQVSLVQNFTMWKPIASDCSSSQMIIGSQTQRFIFLDGRNLVTTDKKFLKIR